MVLIDTDLENVLTMAREEAQRFRHLYIRTEHLLLAMLRLPDSLAYDTLTAVGLDYAQFAAVVEALPCPVCEGEVQLTLSSSAQRVMTRAETFASDSRVNSRHVLLGIIAQASTGRRLLDQLGVDLADLKRLLEGKRDHAQ